MIVCSITVVIHSASQLALIAASMTHMTSLTDTLLVSLVCNVDLIVSLDYGGQEDITFIGRQSTRFDV